jgi:predicted GIY-YIG superfamily endonuclease
MSSTVYLIHLHERINPTHAARHYLGSTRNLAYRLHQHRNGQGARLMEVARERGITFSLARTWSGGRALERRLKRCKNAPRLCPICQAERQFSTPIGARPDLVAPNDLPW